MPSFVDQFLLSQSWTLTSLDDDSTIQGQYAPSNLQHTLAANYAQAPTLGRSQPILQWDGDVLEKMTFTARAFAHYQVGASGETAGITGALAGRTHSIQDLVDAIKSTVRKTDFGRPKVFVFEVGDAIEMTCVVKSVGGVVYDRLRPSDGSLRGVTFRMEIWRYDEYDTTLSDTGAESLVLPVQRNESFESLGFRVYGDPDTGEALRRRNPDKVTPQVGDLIHLPDKSVLMRRFVRTPQNDALVPDNAIATALRTRFLERKVIRRSHVLGSEWDGK